MKVGMLARCDDRGLGIQTWEFFKHVKPDTTVVVVPSPELSRDFTQYPNRYPGAVLASWDGGELSKSALEALREVDVIYSAETLYDPRVRVLGPPVVLYINPEFWRGDEGTTAADTWWVATKWRLHTIPGARIVPVPVPTEDVTPDWSVPATALRVLHVHGHRTHGDRNGTEIFLEVINLLKDDPDYEFRITFADRYWRRNIPPRTTVLEYVPDRWDLYKDSDVLVFPRRYGGLALPLHEAAAKGLALVTPDTVPHDEYPTRRVGTLGFERLTVPAGEILSFKADPAEIVSVLQRYRQSRELLDDDKLRAREWAEKNSWEQLLPLYHAELERAADA